MKKIVAAVLAAAALTGLAAPQASAATSYRRVGTCYIPHFGTIAAAHVQWSRSGNRTYPQLGGYRLIRRYRGARINGTANGTFDRYTGRHYLGNLRHGVRPNGYSYALRNTPYYDSSRTEHHVRVYVSMRDLRTNRWYGCSVNITDGVY